MQVKAIQTRLVCAGEITIEELLAESLRPQDVPEDSIIVVSSKVVALCENRVVPIGVIEKEELIKRESDYYTELDFSKYNYQFTITKNSLIPSAGIDESNADGNYVLWPKDPQWSACEIRRFLCRKFDRQHIGVIISDSTCMPPMRRGTVGVMIGYSGFCATNSLIGKSDLFGRDFQVSRQSVSGGLVAAANLVMGEGTEQTPIAIVYDVPFVKFQDRDPTPDEIAENFIPLEEDLYGPFLKLVPWQKGGGGIYDSSMIL